MDFTVYNTLTRKKELFKPLKENTAGVYTCGPTVYNYAHLGNLRTYIFEDTLKRALIFSGFSVRHVMNVTDVGHLVSDADEGADKMELGSAREGKPAWEIAKFYTEAFFNDFKALNCLMPDIICKATEYIKEMTGLIKKLEAGGFTYKISDGIYFDTSKFPAYGRLAGHSNLEGIKAGARVEFNSEKRNPSDFALWKFSPSGPKRQMQWPSPWGIGFPGWHIECSAMSMKYLGETFDIHCGGVDHIAIHHSNEIAQAEAATGKPFVNYWMHAGFLVEPCKDKMAKSAGGFLTVAALREKGCAPLDYRYFCYTAHYRKQLEFTWEALDSAGRSLASLREHVWNLQAAAKDKINVLKSEAPYLVKFGEALRDDLNIPMALAVVWEVLRHQSLDAQGKLAFIEKADMALGLDLTRPRAQASLNAELSALINERAAARAAKDFKKSDELRKRLREKGVVVEDTPSGQRWKLLVIP